MSRYHFSAYAMTSMPRYIVLWTLHWEVVECRRLEPGIDSSLAMAAAITRFEQDGWVSECDAAYGFTFLSRGAERRLLLVTARDPASSLQQSFSPFRNDEDSAELQ